MFKHTFRQVICLFSQIICFDSEPPLPNHWYQDVAFVLLLLVPSGQEERISEFNRLWQFSHVDGGSGEECRDESGEDSNDDGGSESNDEWSE